MNIINDNEINVKQNGELLFEKADKVFLELSLNAASVYREFITNIDTNLPPLLLFLEDTDELYKKFLSARRIQEELQNTTHAQFIAEDLFDWIPRVLAPDVERVIARQFKGDKPAFVQHAANYFATFTMEDLFIADLDEGGHQSELLVKVYLKQRKRKLWHAMVLLKLVGGYKHLGLPKYVCASLLLEHKRRIKRAQNYVKNNFIVSEEGKVISLADVARKTEHRLAENLNIIYTFEKIARPDPKKPPVYVWAFITLTLPPEKHPNPTMGRNSYDGTSPYASARGMKQDWNRLRALLRKQGIEPASDYYGALISECHGDACQHLHSLLFYRAEHFQIIKQCFLAIFPNLNFDQADKNCSFKLDNGKAKASSYAFKYINKSTTLFDPDIDILGDLDNATENAIANSAFRSYNNIRGVSYFGLENCLTKWRFISRNKGRIPLGSRLKTIVENKDLFAFLDEYHFSYIENEYATKETNRLNAYGEAQKKVSKRFIGCRINDLLYLKNFFSKCSTKTLTEEHRQALATNAKKSRENYDQLNPLVLVSHNYSSRVQKAGAQPHKTGNRVKDWKVYDRLTEELSIFGCDWFPAKPEQEELLEDFCY